jgi:hypothetical protein
MYVLCGLERGLSGSLMGWVQGIPPLLSWDAHLNQQSLCAPQPMTYKLFGWCQLYEFTVLEVRYHWILCNTIHKSPFGETPL